MGGRVRWQVVCTRGEMGVGERGAEGRGMMGG